VTTKNGLLQVGLQRAICVFAGMVITAGVLEMERRKKLQKIDHQSESLLVMHLVMQALKTGASGLFYAQRGTTSAALKGTRRLASVSINSPYKFRFPEPVALGVGTFSLRFPHNSIFPPKVKTNFGSSKAIHFKHNLV
jgi:hypothetical protein